MTEESQRTRLIYCPNCDEWDKILYHGHCEGRLYFRCSHCVVNAPNYCNWDVYWDGLIPEYIHPNQRNKYIAKTCKLLNNYWYK